MPRARASLLSKRRRAHREKDLGLLAEDERGGDPFADGGFWSCYTTADALLSVHKRAGGRGDVPDGALMVALPGSIARVQERGSIGN